MRGRGPKYTPGHRVNIPPKGGAVRSYSMIHDEHSGTFVIKVKKYANGSMNSGPSGKNLKPAKQHARARAEAARALRARSRDKEVPRTQGKPKYILGPSWT